MIAPAASPLTERTSRAAAPPWPAPPARAWCCPPGPTLRALPGRARPPSSARRDPLGSASRAEEQRGIIVLFSQRCPEVLWINSLYSGTYLSEFRLRVSSFWLLETPESNHSGTKGTFKGYTLNPGECASGDELRMHLDREGLVWDAHYMLPRAPPGSASRAEEEEKRSLCCK